MRGWRASVFYFRAIWSLWLPLNTAITVSNKIETNGHDYLPIKLHLRMVNFMLYSIINYYSFSNYFQPFKNIQSFVSSWTIEEQAVGLIWSVYPLHKTLQKQETLSSPKRIPQIPILPSLRWKISPWRLDNLINATGINLLIPDFLSYSICVATTQSCLFIFIFFSPVFWKQLWTAYKPTGIAVFQ